jgi:hypothetical protein
MAENYKRILTDLYRLYLPEKVGEVDELLKRFKGREREMIYKIHIKYGSPDTRRDAQQKLDKLLKEKETAITVVPVQEVPGRRPDPPEPVEVRTRLNWRRIGGLILVLLLLGGAGYAGWQVYNGAWELFPAQSGAAGESTAPEPQFVLANAVHPRTTCNGVDKSSDLLHYGAELSDYQVEGACLKVVSDSGSRYFPGKYFVPEEVFREIDAIFGNDAARAQIKHSFEKRALRIWFRKQGIIGALSAKWKRQIAGPARDPEVWQVFAEDEPADLNSWARGDFTGKNPDPRRPEDLAVVITAADNPTRQQLLFFSFDKQEKVSFHPTLDLDEYPDRLIRSFPAEGDSWKRFFRERNDYPERQGVLLEDPAGTRPDFLLLLEEERIKVVEEVPRDTIRIPGLPPIIL